MRFKAVLLLFTGEVQRGLCMMDGIKIQRTCGGYQSAAATERSVPNNFI
jgi:hypothetical protein